MDMYKSQGLSDKECNANSELAFSSRIGKN